MTDKKLIGEIRTGFGKQMNKKIRLTGQVPAILYGYKEENIALSVSSSELMKIYASNKGKNTLIELTYKKDGKDITTKVITQKCDLHPVKRNIIHVDFLVVKNDRKVHIKVPIHLTGTAIGVKKGGLLMQSTRMLKISCLPDQIPVHINLNISKLDFGHAIKVKDVLEKESFHIDSDPEKILVRVQSPKGLSQIEAEHDLEATETETTPTETPTSENKTEAISEES